LEGPHGNQTSSGAASPRSFPSFWRAKICESSPGRAPSARFEALDGYSASVLLEDLLDENVLLADRLQGEPISPDHGAPLRLIVPHLYGYKNVKHVCAIKLRSDFRRSFADRQTRAHPRGRVALEERGRDLPGPVYRVIYRALIPATLWIYRRAEKRRNRARTRSS
jgi:hypothetical protein